MAVAVLVVWACACASCDAPSDGPDVPTEPDAPSAPDAPDAPDVAVASDVPLDVPADACELEVFYADDDGDGVGDDARTTRACIAPAGYTTVGGDCDDTCVECFPGASEVCNGRDESCDGIADEGVLRTLFADADGDGHGDPAAPATACEPGAGLVDLADDCDDGCADCHPGGVEVCDAAVLDEDCEGGANEGCACTIGATQPCPGGSDVGTCRAGTQRCVAGAWSACEGGVAPVPERCDGADEDCDGTVDGPLASCDPLEHATVSCESSACVVSACDAGWADCDGLESTGCETATSTGACSTCPASCAWGCDGTTCHAATMVSVGDFFACAVRDDGRVACWGNNDVGQLGIGTFGTHEPYPMLVEGLRDTTWIGSGWATSCAVWGGGRFSTWGRDGDGQLGRGLPRPAPTYRPYEVSLPAPAVECDAGIHHVCVSLDDGTVRCAGDGVYLGIGTSADSFTFVPVVGLDQVVHLSAGYLHTCAVRSDGHVFCWGNCFSHKCGSGSGSSSVLRPVEMLGITDAIAVAAGEQHTCVLHADSSVSCVGWNGEGQMGDGTSGSARMTATRVPGLTGVTRLSSWAGTVALTGTTSWAWGAGSYLGDAFPPSILRPVADTPLAGATWVDLNDVGGCAVLSGAPWCWGDYRGLGDGSTTDSRTPRRTVPP